MSETSEPESTGREGDTFNQPAPSPVAGPSSHASLQQGTEFQPGAQQRNGYPQQPQQVTHITVMNPKSVGLAYVLLIFLGGLGVHKFYLDKVGMGLTYLGLGILGGLLTLVWVGWLLIFALWVMLIIDLFTLAGDVHKFNARQHPHPNGNGAYRQQ